ncbi:hypothetical protein E4U60_004520 [Claviceps pazoutovae]|uniref:Uncharacterized protein n=1 Tax=Claviceps pazoutovae TaxID=1649127 RepID=A0A9P7M8Y1_9HYPO|nr:hypothetical protein E4U60_004520 [Claviceps pazoutovae]
MDTHKYSIMGLPSPEVDAKWDDLTQYTAPYTTRWYQKDPRPTGNSDILHECVNWDMLKEEFKRKHVNPWEPGLLVHPVFGPVVPDGKNTVFPERMGFPNDFLHVGETEEKYEERIHRLGISSGRDPE